MAYELEEGEIMSEFTQAPNSDSKIETPSAVLLPTVCPESGQPKCRAADRVRMQALQFCNFVKKRKAEDVQTSNETTIEIGRGNVGDVKAKENKKNRSSLESVCSSLAVDFGDVRERRQKAAAENTDKMGMEQKITQMQTWKESLHTDLTKARQAIESKTNRRGALPIDACGAWADPREHKWIRCALKVISEQRMQETTDRNVNSGSRSFLQSQCSQGVSTAHGALYILDGLNILAGCSRKNEAFSQMPLDWAKLEEACHHFRQLHQDISVFLPSMMNASFQRLRGIFGDIFVERESSTTGIQFMLNTVNIREGARTFKLGQENSFAGDDQIKVVVASNESPLCFLVTNECIEESSACGFLSDAWVARHCIRFAFGPTGFAPL